MENGAWVYIMANCYRGGMYGGVTSDLTRSVWQHREGHFGNTRQVYVERHGDIEPAIARENLVKNWRREWKVAMIEADNPDWLEVVSGGGNS